MSKCKCQINQTSRAENFLLFLVSIKYNLDKIKLKYTEKLFKFHIKQKVNLFEFVILIKSLKCLCNSAIKIYKCNHFLYLLRLFKIR